MTRRERLERKIEKRKEWAAGRRQKASGLLHRNEPYRGDIAFNTQPGHIPERARAIRRDDKAAEHASVAAHHDGKAAGLQAQLDRTIFGDDEDAVEQLEARIAENEAKRERRKKVNALYRKADAAGLAELGLDLEQLRAQVAAVGYSWVKAPYGSGGLSNLGSRIKADRQRIEDIKRRQDGFR